MKAQLDHAYSLIRAGQTEEALTILEELIRENPQNEDAWWLFANGTSDPEAKRNALNNVSSLTTNGQRRAQAQALLQELDTDPYHFEKPKSFSQGSEEWSNSRPLKSNNGCGRIALIGIGALGLLACVACFAFYSFAMPYFSLPDDFENMGELVANESSSGFVTAQESDGYTFEGEAGQDIQVTLELESRAEFPPFIFLFDPNGIIVGVSEDATTGYVRMSQTLPDDGTYVVIVRPFLGFGGGEYSIELDVLD